MNEKRIYTKKNAALFLVVGIVLTVVITAITTVSVSSGMTKALYEEHAYNLSSLMEQISRNIQLTVRILRNEVDFFSAQLGQEEYGSLDSAQRMLKTAEDSLTFSGRLFLIDQDGQCCASDEPRFKWQMQSLLLEADAGGESVYIGALPLIAEKDDTMTFIKPIPTPILAGERRFRYIALAAGMDAIDSFSTASDQGENSMLFIVDTNGSVLYRQARENDLTRVTNVFSTLKHCQFLHDGSYEALEAALRADRRACVCADVSGTAYYVAINDFGEADWFAVMMVPEEDVGVTTESFMNKVVLGVVMIAAVGILLLLATVAVTFRLIRQNQSRVNRILLHEATHDNLTGILNRRGYEELAAALDAQSGVRCLVVSDVDSFKTINDHYGHGAGDRVLRRIAENFTAEFGRMGSVARIGGDEFAVVISGGDMPSFETIRDGIMAINRRLSQPDENGVRCSVSAGCVIEADLLGKMYAKADQALYDSKAKGRCCCSLYEPQG